MDVKHIKDYLSWLYYQYLLITCSYVLEPWEQSIFNTVLLTAIAMMIYSSYVFIPIHVCLAVEFFSGIFGGQHESTMTPMS
ncbi:serine palmitoyltransferase small subunit B [Anomaloglossus baeobatrachus]|uniref:serine palmitoyltransferase small subunit B n=1 Tax=Anomaloglossus baeobatrachus TaxID=238106 RepID=UPI003F50A3A6